MHNKKDKTIEEQLTCLRCNFCKLLPETDMTKKTPIVYCEKKKDKTPLILSGCGLANPANYRKHNEGKVGNGDKLSKIGDVESAWLEVYYSTARWEVIESVTLRSLSTTKNYANIRGWFRSKETFLHSVEKVKETRGRRGNLFTKIQSEFINSCYDKGFWIDCVGNFTETGRERNDKIRRIIVKRVNRMSDNGKVWSWKSIRNHLDNMQPARRRDSSIRNKKVQEKRRLTRNMC